MSDILEMERSMLHRILQGEMAICAHIISTLGGYVFSDEWTNWTWLFVKQQFQDAGEIPERVVIEAQAGHLPAPQSDQLLAEVQAIYGTTPTPSPRAICRTLMQKTGTDNALRLVERVAEKFAHGDAEEAKRLLRTAKEEENTAGPRAKPLFPKKFVPLMLMPRIKTGFFQLDDVIGGIQEGESGLIWGVTGVGKSALSMSLGHAGVIQSVPTIHIDTENGEHITRCRYLSRFTGIAAKLIEQNTMGEQTRARLDKWLERNHDRLANLLQVVYLGMEEHDMGAVEAAIITAKHGGFNPRLAIFDSPDHVVMDEEGDARWEKFAAVSKLWKRTCVRYKLGGWQISQADMSFQDKIATGRSVADSKEKIRNATIGMSINQALDRKGKPLDGERKCLWLEKARNSKARFMIPLLTDLDRMVMKSPPGFSWEHEMADKDLQQETAE